MLKKKNTDLKKETKKTSGNFNIGGEINTGNTQSKIFSFDGELILRISNTRLTAGGSLYEKEVNKKIISSYNRAYTKFDKFFSEKFYFLSNLSSFEDKVKGIKNRSNIGLGLGYQIFDFSQKSFSIESGIIFTKKEDIQNFKQNLFGIRFSSKYNQKIFEKKAEIFNDNEFFLYSNSPANRILFSKTGLRFPLFLNLNASTQLIYRFDNQPFLLRKKSDLSLIFSIGYSW